MTTKHRSGLAFGTGEAPHYAGKLGSNSRVLVTDVQCPYCHVGVGEHCLSVEGTPALNAHNERRRMATRRANQVRVSSIAAYAFTLSPKRRREIRKTARFSQSELASFLGVSVSTFSGLERGTRVTRDEYASLYGAWLRLWNERTP